jgi:hypothetical protein
MAAARLVSRDAAMPLRLVAMSLLQYFSGNDGHYNRARCAITADL